METKEIDSERLIAIGDVHGCFNELVTLIRDVIKYDAKKDSLVFLGDYIDRGPQSSKVIEYVKYLKRENPDGVVLLKGNHEAMAENFFNALRPINLITREEKADLMMLHMLWVRNGGDTTLGNYAGLTIKHIKDILLPFIESLAISCETSTHLFAHSGLTMGKTLETISVDELLWNRDFTYDGEKPMVIGHTIIPHPKKFKSLVCIDTGCFHTGKLTAYDTMNDTFYSNK